MIFPVEVKLSQYLFTYRAKPETEVITLVCIRRKITTKTEKEEIFETIHKTMSDSQSSKELVIETKLFDLFYGVYC